MAQEFNAEALRMASHLLIGGVAAWVGADALGWFRFGRGDARLPDSERERLEALRKDWWYRIGESFIRSAAPMFASWLTPLCRRLAPEMALIDRNRFAPSELLAMRFLQAMIPAAILCALALGVLRVGPAPMAFIFLGSTVAVFLLLFRRDLNQAALYRRKVRARLPFAIEIIALLIESGGADIYSCLETIAVENRGHPLGFQFSSVIADISGGLTVAEALRAWGDRYGDEDVREATFVMRTAIQRGTTLKESLRSLAEQSRTRRIQRLERAAEEAKVHITWPGMLVMLACLIIVAAPMILAARDILTQ